MKSETSAEPAGTPDAGPRRTPARPDLAAASLRGRIAAPRYVEGRAACVCEGVIPVRRAPQPDAPLDTEALFGEAVTVFEEHEGFAWAQLAADDYVGYLPAASLRSPGEAPTHRVRVVRTFVYAGPSIKSAIVMALPLNARVTVRRTEGAFAIVDAGFVFGQHLDDTNAPAADFVGIAERFVGVPYLWGGKTGWGLDCSGLVQTSLAACDIAAPRDTDMMVDELGTEVGAIDTVTLRRGDLLFWKGHVGILRDAATLLHASGHHMLVVSEPLATARARIRAETGADVTRVRRL